MNKLDGRLASKQIGEKIKKQIKDKGYSPRLVIFQVGDNPASNKYIKFKMKKAEQLGVTAVNKKLHARFPQGKLIQDIKDMAPWVDGIIVQLPLPEGYETQKVLDAVPHDKDVDGLATGNKLFTPATPRGIMSLLEINNVEIKGKVAAVIGQSNLVGKPVADLLEKAGASKVMRFTKETGIEGSEEADILIVAAGQKNLVKAENIKEGVVLVDVGINDLGNGKISGDVDVESVGDKPSMLSPVPGGVGPMTVISLFDNLIDAIK